MRSPASRSGLFTLAAVLPRAVRAGTTALCVICMTAPAVANTSTPISGTWKGPIRDGEGVPVRGTLTVKPSLKTGRPAGKYVNVSNFTCRYNLIFKRRSGARYYFTNQVVGGTNPAQCLTEALVTISRDGPQVRFRIDGTPPTYGLLSRA
jgi:hypothetical protein